MSISARTRLGVLAGTVAGAASRRLGRGAGATLPGKVTLAVAPGALADLAAGRTSVVLTGTNGKTTTTAFLVAALEDDASSPGGGRTAATVLPGGPRRSRVVTNATGANMATGIVSALAAAPAAASPLAVLETDELHVPSVMRAVRPSVLVLLNLSRDQLDRTHEVRRAADLWRDAIASRATAAGEKRLTVVANAADPNIAAAVLDGAAAGEGDDGVSVVWVDGGLRWFGDAELCPRCGDLLEVDDDGWRCACGLAQPEAGYRVVRDAADTAQAVEATLETPGGARITLAPSLPGSANVSNAAFAVAAAAVLGVAPAVAASRLTAVGDVAGRYGTLPLGAARRPARMLLAKNPAGWTVALDLLEPDAVVALGVNARTQDGTDTSWLWDVPFELLAGRTVGVFGDRAADLELRLVHAGVDTVRAPGEGNVRDAHRLADALPEGDLTVLATYTTFQEVRRDA